MEKRNEVQMLVSTLGRARTWIAREAPAIINPDTDEGVVANPVSDEENALACHQGRNGTLMLPIASFATRPTQSLMKASGQPGNR